MFMCYKSQIIIVLYGNKFHKMKAKHTRLSEHFKIKSLDCKNIDNMDTPNTHTYDKSLAWGGTCTSIKICRPYASFKPRIFGRNVASRRSSAQALIQYFLLWCSLSVLICSDSLSCSYLFGFSFLPDGKWELQNPKPFHIKDSWDI
jgi:hypothetical protein